MIMMAMPEKDDLHASEVFNGKLKVLLDKYDVNRLLIQIHADSPQDDFGHSSEIVIFFINLIIYI